MSKFECLFFLENADLQLIEVKRTDLPEDAHVAEKFRWLRIEKETMEISSLHFASMDSSAEIQERYFQEGYLKFNETSGTFIEKFNSAQHPLDRKLDLQLSTPLENAIAAFLQQPNLVAASEGGR